MVKWSQIAQIKYSADKSVERVYAERQNKVLWCKDYFENTTRHTYLSLYTESQGQSRCSSIELNKNCTFSEGCLNYKNGETTLVYKIHEKDVYEKLKSLWEKTK